VYCCSDTRRYGATEWEGRKRSAHLHHPRASFGQVGVKKRGENRLGNDAFAGARFNRRKKEEASWTTPDPRSEKREKWVRWLEACSSTKEGEKRRVKWSGSRRHPAKNPQKGGGSAFCHSTPYLAIARRRKKKKKEKCLRGRLRKEKKKKKRRRHLRYRSLPEKKRGPNPERTAVHKLRRKEKSLSVSG